jgi:hypothetical protein
MLTILNRLWDHPVLPLLVLLFANLVFYLSVASEFAQG